MRNLLLLVLGLALGAVIASILLNAMYRREAYARGVMQVLQHQYAPLRERLRKADCANIDVSDSKHRLAELTEEIEPSTYPDSKPDAPFREYTSRLREAVADLPTGSASCAAVAPIVTRIGDACETCHRQYR
jgi:hypothetical protein